MKNKNYNEDLYNESVREDESVLDIILFASMTTVAFGLVLVIFLIF